MKIDINKYQVMHGISDAIIHAFLLLTALTCLFPLVWMFRSSLMTLDTIFIDKSFIPAKLHFGNYIAAWTKGGFAVYLGNSIVYTVVVVFGIVVISSLAAFAFSRLRFPGKNIFYIVFLSALMIPLPGSFVPLFVLVQKLGLVNTRIGYILCMINVGLPMSIIMLKTFFDRMPSDLEDVARIDGCSNWQIWWHVGLPFAKPALAVIIIFNALNVWNEYILAQLLLNENNLMPLQVGLMRFQGAHSVDYPVLMAGLTIAAVPIILVYSAMQKHCINDLSMGELIG